MKIEIQSVPDIVLEKCNEITNDKSYYHSKLGMDVIKNVIGTCRICEKLCSKIIIIKDHGIEEIQRYCNTCFDKQKKYMNRKRKKVNKK